jgi:predicted ATPase
VITRVQALNFRTLRYVDQQLGEFHAIVGPNGSGKSSFLDAIAILSDITRSGVEGAIYGDPGMGVAQRSSDPRMLTWMCSGQSFEIAVEIQIPNHLRDTGRFDRVRYEIGIHTGDSNNSVSIAFENLYLIPPNGAGTTSQRNPELFPDPPPAPETLLTFRPPPGWKSVVRKTSGGKDYFQSERTKYNTQFTMGIGRSALSGLPADVTRFPVAVWARSFLQQGVQRIQLDAESMRLAAPPGLSSVYRPDGSNLAWVVDDFKKRVGADRFGLWVDHVGTAVPGVVGIDTVIRDDDRHRYLVVTYNNGLKAPSWVLSDGTLRILALTLLAYLDEVGGLILVEEPENGVHPRAVDAVVAALSQVSGRQLLLASHSPVVLGALADSQVLCFAKNEDGATAIVRGDLHPALKDWRNRPDLGDLLVAGVLG